MRRMQSVIALTLLFCLLGCTKNVAGVYVGDKNKKKVIELRSDSTFVIRDGSIGTFGKYSVDGDVITFTFYAGSSIKAQIHGDVISDEVGNMWTKGNPPATTASSGSLDVSPARRAANESEAAASLRTINTVEVTYMTMFPTAGYAPNLSALSTGGTNCNTPTPDHACLIDQTLGCASAWCVKDGYQFAIVSTAKATPLTDYTATATPVDANNGHRNFCSTPDAVIREQTGPPLTQPLTLEECGKWTPV